MPATSDGGLGSHLVGDKVQMGPRSFHVTKLLGEGGFSFVYQVKELLEGISASLHQNTKDKQGNGDDPPVRRSSGSGATKPGEAFLVLKVTSVHSRSQRDIAEKEAKLLSRLSHPSIIKMFDTCYRNVAHTGSTGKRDKPGSTKERPQHLILLEYCEGGHALDVCSKLAESGQRFDLSTLIIAFGQICNAVSYLHAQRPPIVHRDLKPVNFLVKNGAYKLCDFGSAVFGHVDLRTPKARAEAEEVIEKTTTQMFRSPEMVDLYMAKKLTQATDVWALGACLYSLAFLQNCFEEGSNLAILSRKYTIPEDNPYGEGLEELLDRMLSMDSKARADMTEVILCLSAVYSGRPLPPRKKSSKSHKSEGQEDSNEKKEKEKIGSFRTDGQGIGEETVYDPTKATEGKKLASNSVAARRKRAAATLPPTAPTSTLSAPPSTTQGQKSDPLNFSSFHSDFSQGSDEKGDAGFGTEGFGEMKGFDTKGDAAATDFFGSFDDAAMKPAGGDAFAAAFDTGASWGDKVAAPETAPAASQDQAQDSEAAPAASQDAAEPGMEPSAATTGDDKKNDSPDSQRKERSRRRRAGGSSRSSRPNNVEGGAEAVNVSDDGASEKKERKSRSTRADEDKEHRRRRSGSRSKRKVRPPRDGARSERDSGASGSNPDKNPPKKGSSSSVRGAVDRKQKQAPSDP